jgi:5,10-methenyltetrahydromethanopterin hydrogenase
LDPTPYTTSPNYFDILRDTSDDEEAEEDDATVVISNCSKNKQECDIISQLKQNLSPMMTLQ